MKAYELTPWKYEEQTNTNNTNASEDEEDEKILNIPSGSLYFEERYNEEPTRNRTKNVRP